MTWLDDRAATARSEFATPQDKIEALADLVINHAVPADLAQTVLVAIGDGWLSPAGDVLGWPESEGSARVYIEGTSLLGGVPDEG